MPHKLNKFSINGITVSPAPRNTPVMTMDAANSGSASMTTRITFTPSCCTSTSGVNIANIIGDVKNNIIARIPIIAIPNSVIILAKSFARSFLPAPIACPINVVAAAAIPYPGI